jgi:hypothetical protein
VAALQVVLPWVRSPNGLLPSRLLLLLACWGLLLRLLRHPRQSPTASSCCCVAPADMCGMYQQLINESQPREHEVTAHSTKSAPAPHGVELLLRLQTCAAYINSWSTVGQHWVNNSTTRQPEVTAWMKSHKNTRTCKIQHSCVRTVNQL